MDSREHTVDLRPAAFEPAVDPHVPDGPIHPGSGRGFDWRRLFAPLGAFGLLVAKFGLKLKALLLLLPKLKILTTSGSMLVSVAAYSLFWGWKFAAGFVALIFVHEMGHVFQLRREGIKASAPMFIPFMGAVIWAKSLGNNAAAEARVGLAGPILGSLGAAALIPIADATGNELFKALAFTGLFLNLFNLLPVLPLDGGRAMAALSPWMWLVGFTALVGVAFAFPNPIILVIVLLAGLETWRRWRGRNSPEARKYYEVSTRDRVLTAVVYLGLIVLLTFGMSQTHVQRDL
jgi:Zn-dependent protease